MCLFPLFNPPFLFFFFFVFCFLEKITSVTDNWLTKCWEFTLRYKHCPVRCSYSLNMTVHTIQSRIYWSSLQINIWVTLFFSSFNSFDNSFELSQCFHYIMKCWSVSFLVSPATQHYFINSRWAFLWLVQSTPILNKFKYLLAFKSLVRLSPIWQSFP